jgi:ribonuclease-3
MSDVLARKLKYTFKDPALLTLALTHRSCSDKNNERLEFLGDGLVNFVMAEAVYQQFPQIQEGDLSRLRASLVNRDALGELARKFEVGRYLNLGPGELKSGGNERLSILSCAMEAIIGAIYLDGGFEVARMCLLNWCEPQLSALKKSKGRKDPKTTLQEHLQSHRLPLPIYEVESVEGEVHQQTFIVSCQIEGRKQKVLGRGSSRRRAEQEAAELMLGIIKK